ncbi:SLAM family member 5-like [Cyclopterus lumpus]|uniref:SLAM family member 5-like n=1 Tax=Cyclopterus lumpus TaxID=8103 RepID=UPI001485DFA3|nr:SLAM family member 5-like [Cyclopterus lumpus]
MSSCLPPEGVSSAKWKYKELIIEAKGKEVSVQPQFKDRVELNPTSFSLTVRTLTLQDSGDFIFMSEANDQQRPTVIITLHVHEPITTKPVVTSKSSWHASNNSCGVTLLCSAATDSGVTDSRVTDSGVTDSRVTDSRVTDSRVTYSWAVRNQTSSGSRLQYIITPQDGDTGFTCSVSNVVSEKSESVTVKCSRVSYSSSLVLLIVGPVIGLLLFILLLLFYTKSKGPCCNRDNPSQTVNQDDSQHQVYSSLLHVDGCVYETLRGVQDAGTDLVAAS